ncbi:MAG: DNA-directed RNA polymerase subunit omega [Deltaproteobacteria bacterium]|nr:DNA-directed RNA polymerase subunit omega [Deltaproteobacteria bacterium]
MARITIEDCLNNVNNRFTLIHMVARRVRQLRKGAEPTISTKNRDIVLSLREIAEGNITIQTEEEARLLSESKKDILPEPAENTFSEEELL